MFCQNCGKQVKEEGSFCEFCGTAKFPNAGNNRMGGFQKEGTFVSTAISGTGSIMNSMGLVLPTVLIALFNAIYIILPVSSMSISVFGYSSQKGTIPAYEYFGLANRIKTNLNMEDYWKPQVDLLMGAIIIVQIIAIYFAYKMINCLIKNKMTYVGEYSRYTSVSAIIGVVLTVIFNSSFAKMMAEIVTYDVVDSENTIWVWIVGISAAINVLFVSKLVDEKCNHAMEEEKTANMITNGWTCKKCGLTNPNYIGTCSCGNSKFG